MREFAIGLFTCLIGVMISAIINMIHQYKEDEARYKSMNMLGKYLKYGSVVLMTKTNGAIEETNNAIFVKNEKWFWKVFKEFNRVASGLFDDKTVKASISAEVDCFGKKQFKYYFEGIKADRED